MTANFSFSEPNGGGMRVVRCGEDVIGLAEEVEPGVFIGTSGSGAKTEPASASQVAKALRQLPQAVEAPTAPAEPEAVRASSPYRTGFTSELTRDPFDKPEPSRK